MDWRKERKEEMGKKDEWEGEGKGRTMRFICRIRANFRGRATRA